MKTNKNNAKQQNGQPKAIRNLWIIFGVLLFLVILFCSNFVEIIHI